MALSLSSVLQQSSATSFGTGNFTSSSFTPPDNCLLIVVQSFITTSGAAATGSTLTFADSAGLTETSRIATGTSPAWTYGTRIWTMPVTTGASMTVTTGLGGVNAFVYRVEVLAATGHDAVTPTGATASGSDADGDGAVTITLSGSPAIDSIVIATAAVCMNTGSNAVTPGADFTEWPSSDVAFLDWFGCELQTRTASTSTSVSWVDLSTSGAPTAAVLCALEIKAGSGGGGASVPSSRLSLLGVGL